LSDIALRLHGLQVSF